MQNYFAIETEAAFRQSEWKRAKAAADRLPARLENGRGRRVRPRHIARELPRAFSARLGALRSLWSTAAERKRAPTPCNEALLP